MSECRIPTFTAAPQRLASESLGMNKEICFISSPGNGLSCCCRCRPNFPARRGHQKRKEVAEPDPNPVRAVETERRRKTAGREALRRSDERRSARVGEAESDAASPRRQVLGGHSSSVSSSHLSLTGSIPTHSPTSPTSTSRAARAHDADLQICRSVPP